MKYTNAILLLASLVVTSNAEEDTSTSDGHVIKRIRCPYFRQGKLGDDRLPSHKTTDQRRKEWAELPEVKALTRKYTPGTMSEGETFCSSDAEHKFCNKIHGEWGDSIPNNGEYCIFVILEFEDPEDFRYHVDQVNTDMFDAIFQNEFGYLNSPDYQDTWLIVGGTSGLVGGDPSAPWPFSSIIWKYGNEHAKPFISDRHRANAQVPGLGWGWIFHGHYKAVKCADVWPTFEANGLNQSMFEPVLKVENDNYANLWNAFSDMKSYHEDFYPEDNCHIGPCPGDGTPPDVVAEE